MSPCKIGKPGACGCVQKPFTLSMGIHARPGSARTAAEGLFAGGAPPPCGEAHVQRRFRFSKNGRGHSAGEGMLHLTHVLGAPLMTPAALVVTRKVQQLSCPACRCGGRAQLGFL